MFEPVSMLPYVNLEPAAQALVIYANDAPAQRWIGRAAVALSDRQVDATSLRDVVRDLLANPHIRIVVFEPDVVNRLDWDEFWGGKDVADWRIDAEHLALVRQFVDLYDEDFGVRGPLQPFWPARIRYLE